MDLVIRPMTAADSRAAVGWRYEEPYSFYNPDPANREEDMLYFLDPVNGYSAIADERGDLLGYVCFGEDAQVTGGDYSSPALDIGIGMRPDLTGRGGGRVVLATILDYARRNMVPIAFRVTVASFNGRALRLCEQAGFRPVQTFSRVSDGDEREFQVLVREV